MSNLFERSQKGRIQRLMDAIEQADQHVCDLASGKKKWNMCIPARSDDSDVLISDTLRSSKVLINELLSEIEILKKEIKSNI